MSKRRHRHVGPIHVNVPHRRKKKKRRPDADCCCVVDEIFDGPCFVATAAHGDAAEEPVQTPARLPRPAPRPPLPGPRLHQGLLPLRPLRRALPAPLPGLQAARAARAAARRGLRTARVAGPTERGADQLARVGAQVVPAQRSISASAASRATSAGRYGRPVVIVSQASASAISCGALRDRVAGERRSGSRAPSQRSWWWRIHAVCSSSRRRGQRGADRRVLADVLELGRRRARPGGRAARRAARPCRGRAGARPGAGGPARPGPSRALGERDRQARRPRARVVVDRARRRPSRAAATRAAVRADQTSAASRPKALAQYSASSARRSSASPSRAVERSQMPIEAVICRPSANGTSRIAARSRCGGDQRRLGAVAGQQPGELLAADPPDDVDRARRRGEPPGGLGAARGRRPGGRARR